jgi:hypothetical protein
MSALIFFMGSKSSYPVYHIFLALSEDSKSRLLDKAANSMIKLSVVVSGLPNKVRKLDNKEKSGVEAGEKVAEEGEDWKGTVRKEVDYSELKMAGEE